MKTKKEKKKFIHKHILCIINALLFTLAILGCNSPNSDENNNGGNITDSVQLLSSSIADKENNINPHINFIDLTFPKGTSLIETNTMVKIEYTSNGISEKENIPIQKYTDSTTNTILRIQLGSLKLNTTYTLIIPAGTLRLDSLKNKEITLSFTTMKELVATNFIVNSDLGISTIMVRFNANIKEGMGNIILSYTGGEEPITIDITDTAKVMIEEDSSIITILGLENREYTITLPAGIVHYATDKSIMNMQLVAKAVPPDTTDFSNTLSIHTQSTTIIIDFQQMIGVLEGNINIYSSLDPTHRTIEINNSELLDITMSNTNTALKIILDPALYISTSYNISFPVNSVSISGQPNSKEIIQSFSAPSFMLTIANSSVTLDAITLSFNSDIISIVKSKTITLSGGIENISIPLTMLTDTNIKGHNVTIPLANLPIPLTLNTSYILTVPADTVMYDKDTGEKEVLTSNKIVISEFQTAPLVVIESPPNIGINSSDTLVFTFNAEITDIKESELLSILLHLKDEEDKEIFLETSIDLNNNNKLIAILPELKLNGNYSLTLPMGIVEKDGIKNQEFIYNFKAFHDLLLVSKPNLKNLPIMPAPLEFTFNTNISKSTENDKQSTLINSDRETIEISTSTNGNTLSITINEELQSNQTYTLTLPIGVVSANGIDSKELNEYTLTTIKSPFVVTANNSLSIPLNNANIIFTFNEEIEKGSEQPILVENGIATTLEESSLTIPNDNQKTLRIALPTLDFNRMYTLTLPAGTIQSQDNHISNIVYNYSFTTVDINGDGLIEISTIEELHNMRYNLAGTSYKTSADAAGLTGGCPTTGCKGYELIQDLNFDADGDGSTWTGNSSIGFTLDMDDNNDIYFNTSAGGWQPIGTFRNPFNATFDGNGYTISNLAITRDAANIGLFSYTNGANIRRIGLINNLADYSGKSDSTIYIGGLVGFQQAGDIIYSYTTGSADGGDGANDNVGGLVGRKNEGRIIASYTTGNVNGGGGYDNVGGLVSWQNEGSIIASYTTGTVKGGDGSDAVGGLVGWQDGGSIIASYASGDVDGGDGNDDRVGGLVGNIINRGTSTASYGFANISGEEELTSAGTSPPVGVTTAIQLTADNSESEWNDSNESTLGAWDFGDASQHPILKYSDYDGPEGENYNCDLFLTVELCNNNTIIMGQMR